MASYSANQYKIDNPLFNDKKLESLNDNNVKDIENFKLQQKFTKVYGVCLRPLTKYNEYFSDRKITYSNRQKLLNSYMIYEIPFSTLNIKKIKNNLFLLEESLIKNINPLEYEINEYTLCVLFLNLKYDNLKLFTDQFHHRYKLDDFIKVCIMNKYYDIKENKFIIKKLLSILEDISGYKFWEYSSNTNLNQTLSFLNRRLDFKNCEKIQNKDVRKIIKDIKNKNEQDNDYLSYMYNSYFDIAQAIRTRGYGKYKMNETITDYNIESFDKFIDFYVKDENIYAIFRKILLNKNLCHLVLKSKFLIKLKFTVEIEKLFRYSYLTLLIEENIKKSYTKFSDRHIFTLRQLENLPVYYTEPDEILTHPLYPQLIDEKTIEIKNNFLPCHFIGGIVSMEEYKRRLNLFLTGDINMDVFKGFKHWDKFIITGSVNATIIPKYTGIFLQYFFNKSIYEEEYKDIPISKYLYNALDKYYSTYLKNSDIDIMNKNPTWDGWFGDLKKIKDIVELNTCEKSLLKFNKTVCILVNEKFLNTYICKIKDLDEGLLHKYINEDLEIKTKIYEYYKKYQILENEKNLGKEIFKDEFFISFHTIVPIKNVCILVKRTNQDWIDYFKKIKNNDKPPRYNSNVDKSYNFPVNNCLCDISINIKCKITNPKLKKPLEVFRVRNKNFAGVISRFHVDPVRAAYQGPIYKDDEYIKEQVYIFPSAYASYCTGGIRDLKYFAGKRDPMEILNSKHAKLGYGTIMNSSEKIRGIEYSYRVDYWNKAYNFKTLNSASELFLGKPNGKYIFDINGKIQYNFILEDNIEWFDFVNNEMNKDNKFTKDEYKCTFNRPLSESIVSNLGYLKNMKK